MESFVDTPAPAVRTLFSRSSARARIEDHWDTALRRELGGERVAHGNLVEATEELAARLKLAAPRLYIAEAFPPVFGGKVPNMMALVPKNPHDRGAIAITKAKLTMEHCLPHGEVPAPLRATLAHELAHFKQGYKYVDACRKYPMLLGPVIAVAALAIYEGMGQKTEEGKSADTEPAAALSQLEQNIRSGAKYLLAAGAGLAGGMLTTRHLMRHIEFEADRVAAQLVSPQAMKDALESAKTYFKNLSAEEWKAASAQYDAVPMWKKIYENYIEHAHPSHSERYAALDEIARQQQAGRIR